MWVFRNTKIWFPSFAFNDLWDYVVCSRTPIRLFKQRWLYKSCSTFTVQNASLSLKNLWLNFEGDATYFFYNYAVLTPSMISIFYFVSINNVTNFYEVNFNHITATNANKFLYHKAWCQEKKEFFKGVHNPIKSLPL